MHSCSVDGRPSNTPHPQPGLTQVTPRPEDLIAAARSYDCTWVGKRFEKVGCVSLDDGLAVEAQNLRNEVAPLISVVDNYNVKAGVGNFDSEVKIGNELKGVGTGSSLPISANPPR